MTDFYKRFFQVENSTLEAVGFHTEVQNTVVANDSLGSLAIHKLCNKLYSNVTNMLWIICAVEKPLKKETTI